MTGAEANWRLAGADYEFRARQKTEMFKRWYGIALAVGGLALALAWLALVPTSAEPALDLTSSGNAFVYLFDPLAARFIFAFTLPSRDAVPQDIIAIPGAGYQDVWFTEPGIDRIGRLTYTSTQLYTFREYTLTAGSHPLNLVASGGTIWFTQAGRNRIGRLDPTSGLVDEFEAPTANSLPADLDVAPDGSIWFTEMAAGKIARLVVSGSAYTITEYVSLSNGQPYGIVAVGSSVYFAQTAADCVTQFTPPDGWVHIKGFVAGVPDEPYKLVQDAAGQVWGTERAGNQISQFDYGTLPVIARYSLSPANSMPSGLAADANHHLWFTQWRAGQIGRLVRGGTPRKDYYPLPQPDLAPTGIAADSAGKIWVLASRPHRIYLPLTLRNFQEE